MSHLQEQKNDDKKNCRIYERYSKTILHPWYLRKGSCAMLD